MNTITLTATVPEHLVEKIEDAEMEWAFAEEEEPENGERNQECRHRAEAAYLAFGRAVLEQYYATLTKEPSPCP
jgi:hypothetical protein